MYRNVPLSETKPEKLLTFFQLKISSWVWKITYLYNDVCSRKTLNAEGKVLLE
jgi:hypothetical protein